MTDARRMAALAAEALKVDENTVFPCSTGTIGKPLPMDKIENGIGLLTPALSRDGGDAAAKAIMTTDTVDKQHAVEIEVDGRAVRVGGMAKGAGMIEPNMATMLAFLTTDAAVQSDALQACLSAAVEASFNRISVDGDQSTNDTALLLANGAAGNRPLGPAHPGWSEFCAAVGEVCKQLAWKIVKDGEGATKFVTITVTGAVSNADASKVARAVANSLLVKTSWFGGDPNWGRIIAAAGYSGADVTTELTDVSFDGVVAVRGGLKAPEFALKDLERILRQKAFGIQIDLHKGSGTDTVYTCDCSYEYVKINAEYMT
jgi:glutamate N-acetyltransferase/amino-acid N-acetyltransferase